MHPLKIIPHFAPLEEQIFTVFEKQKSSSSPSHLEDLGQKLTLLFHADDTKKNRKSIRKKITKIKKLKNNNKIKKQLIEDALPIAIKSKKWKLATLLVEEGGNVNCLVDDSPFLHLAIQAKKN